MVLEFEKDDSGIRVHERGVIAQLCSLFRSHENGLPEWFKNSSTAYARENVPSEYRVLSLFSGKRADGTKYIALLDHVGMTVEDLEQRFAKWGDPEAHAVGVETEEVLEGGHGNGGKCYMTQMFEQGSFLHTVKKGRGSRYGFVGEDPHPGYFPNKKAGRGFPVAKVGEELRRVLVDDLGVDYAKIPEELRTAAAVRDGFTLVVGLGPKHFDGKEALRKLINDSLGHPQMQITVQKTRIYVLIDGKPVRDLCPIRLPEIEPHELAIEPRIFPIPDEVIDPVTNDICQTRAGGSPQGALILKTSKVSMRRSLKSQHHVTYFARNMPIGFLRMDNVSRTTWVDRMYGECRLDSLKDFETPDRGPLASGPLSRAIEDWVKERIFEYEAEFRKKDRLLANQEQRNKLQELNKLLDRWKNKLLDDADFGAGGAGESEGRPPRDRPPRRPLSQAEAREIIITTQFKKAGIGVWLRMNVEFRGEDGERVADPAYQWNSSDWAVATVDQENRVITHTPGTVDLWIETVDGKVRSAPVTIEVLDTMRVRVEPETLDVTAGQFHTLAAVVVDRAGNEHRDVFMTWIQDDSSVLHVTSLGRIIARKQGTTTVSAMDEHCMEPAGCKVKVVPAKLGPGDKGKAYPRILLSEVDKDPLNPDGETVHMSPEDGPVHQPTPQHVEHNIWWINLSCPLARLYFEDCGPDSREWRSYHIERYIEALAKIRLSQDFQLGEEELTFDEVERRWREVAAEVQKRALEDLRGVLEGGDLESEA